MGHIYVGIGLVILAIIFAFVGFNFLGSVAQQATQNTTDSQQATQPELTPAQEATRNMGFGFLGGAVISFVIALFAFKE